MKKIIRPLSILTACIWAGMVSAQIGFAPPRAYSVGNCHVTDVAVGDLNQDGNMDIAAIVSSDVYHLFISTHCTNGDYVSILLGNGDGSFLPEVRYLLGGGRSPSAIVLADFNNDGILDMATSNYARSAISVLLGAGDGTFLSKVDYLPGNYGAISIRTGDLDNDGNTDLVFLLGGDLYFTCAGNSAGILPGKGDGTFHGPFFQPLTCHYGIAIEDMNNDGNLDMITADWFDPAVYIFPGTGSGHFLDAVPYSMGDSWSWFSVIAADLNNDGHTDIATVDTWKRSISILYGDTYSSPAIYPTGTSSNAYAMTTADFNADGFPDIVVAHYEAGSISVMAGNADGHFLPPVLYDTGKSPFALATGDFNNDGFNDIVVANLLEGQVSVLLYDPPTGINHIQYPPIHIYPTPATGYFYVDLPSPLADDALLEVTGVSGRLVQSIRPDTQTQAVDAGGLPSGVYHVRYRDRSRNMTGKILIVHH